MKKLIALCACLMFLFTLGESLHLLLGRSARVNNAEISADASPEYTEKEIRAAMRAVKHKFIPRRCTLLRLRYDEGKSASQAPSLAAKYGADEAIVIYGDLVTDADERVVRTGLAPGTVYRNVSWTFVRSHGGRWKLKTWGFA